ncbi:hypothetical protein SRABI27_03771 [Pedobacter sp. Bi27]|uniref:hypothetical protein n=1 Tax=Pedobacter sp. Bi27 TaxID=2822351 RepID=UPI001D75DA28|nr:hypothetical protein [Pedobacter sp. Bi27]CAH0280900.1 hypothetical protein SRABI27_03771 [Pedobacter sp. Bi27]
MKQLLIHNDNVNPELLVSFEHREALYPSRAEMLEDDFDMDRFFDSKLAALLNVSYDCIFMPFTLNNFDYLEFTGLQVAAHIRLSPYLNHCRTPLVFVGGDDPADVFKLKPLASLLFTHGIYFLGEPTVAAKEQLLEQISNYPKVSDAGYKLFLDRIQVDPPANYSSYHSLANEWGIKKLSELFKLTDLPNGVKEDIVRIEDRFKTNLYFKLLEQKLDKARNKIKNSEKIPPVLPNLDNARVLYIDDEHDKGWQALFEFLFSSASAKLLYYDAFKKGLKREELFQALTAFIDLPGNEVDFYIVDLRLCDEDMHEADPMKLSGMRVLEYLLKKNKGNQVVLLTASNKTWNLQAAFEVGAAGYIIKESPELNYTSKQTAQLFTELKKAFQKAFRNAYLADLWTFIKLAGVSADLTKLTHNNFSNRLLGEGGWLEQIFTLLSLDKSVVYKQVLVVFVSILEGYCDACFKNGTELYVILKDNSEVLVGNNNDEGMFTFDFGKYSYQLTSDDVRKEVRFHAALQKVSTFVKENEPRLLVKVVSVLHFRNNFTEAELEKVMELVFLRNSVAAHGGQQKVNESLRYIRMDDIKLMITCLKKMFV